MFTHLKFPWWKDQLNSVGLRRLSDSIGGTLYRGEIQNWVYFINSVRLPRHGSLGSAMDRASTRALSVLSAIQPPRTRSASTRQSSLGRQAGGLKPFDSISG